MADLTPMLDESGMLTIFRKDGTVFKVYPVDAREILLHSFDKDGKPLYSMDDPLKRVVGRIEPPAPNLEPPSKANVGTTPAKIASNQDLSKMDKADLLALGKTLGLDLSATLDNASIREAIQEELADPKKS
jgi:hypothetical protein